MLNPYTRHISEEKCIVGWRHLVCRCELAEGDQSCETAFRRKINLCVILNTDVIITEVFSDQSEHCRCH